MCYWKIFVFHFFFCFLNIECRVIYLLNGHKSGVIASHAWRAAMEMNKHEFLSRVEQVDFRVEHLFNFIAQKNLTLRQNDVAQSGSVSHNNRFPTRYPHLKIAPFFTLNATLDLEKKNDALKNTAILLLKRDLLARIVSTILYHIDDAQELQQTDASPSQFAYAACCERSCVRALRHAPNALCKWCIHLPRGNITYFEAARGVRGASARSQAKAACMATVLLAGAEYVLEARLKEQLVAAATPSSPALAIDLDAASRNASVVGDAIAALLLSAPRAAPPPRFARQFARRVSAAIATERRSASAVAHATAARFGARRALLAELLHERRADIEALAAHNARYGFA